MKNKYITILFAVFLLIVVSGCTNQANNNLNNGNTNNSGTNNNNNNNNYQNNSTNNNTNYQATNKTYALGETFTFDGLELTLDTNYTFVTVNNRFSDLNGRSVIKIGVNVKNVSSEKNSLNYFFYDMFGSKGIELDGVSSYFDETVDYAGDLKPNASYKKYFYILYDGDGTYSIDFDNYSQELSVEFNITK